MSISVVKRRATRMPQSGSRAAEASATSAAAPVTGQSDSALAGRIDFSAFLQSTSVIERTLKERENPPGE